MLLISFPIAFDAGSIKSDGEEEEEEEELFHDATDNLEDQQSTLEHYSQSTQENGSSERSSSAREFSNRGEEKAICQNSRRPLAMTKGKLDLSKCNIQMPVCLKFLNTEHMYMIIISK
jgi:hypothetical protein